MMFSLFRLLLVSTGFFVTSVNASIDSAYVDPTFNCPATTTCPQLCVADAEACPPEMRCPADETLCADGSCALFCDNSTTVSPCSSECAPVTCALAIATYDVCNSYSDLYGYASDCGSLASDADVKANLALSWTDPGYLFVYIWMTGVTASIVAWCWFNQKVSPVPGSTQTLCVEAGDDGEMHLVVQTGCKLHPIGIVLHVLTLLTYAGWAVLLAITTKLYYQFEDEANIVMALKAFCWVWNIGFIWCMALRWPHSLQSLFYRRCQLSEATHVAVLYKTDHRDDNDASDQHLSSRTNDASAKTRTLLSKWVVDILLAVSAGFRAIMTQLYAADTRPNSSEGLLKYCKVCENPDGTKYFVFLFRRYNFDEEREIYVQGSWNLGTTFDDLSPEGIGAMDDIELSFQQALSGDINPEKPKSFRQALQQQMEKPFMKYLMYVDGLSEQDVEERRRIVGPNVIDMPKPSLPAIFFKEITKPFYVYQFYILWIWMTIQYWYMACCNWTIVLATAGVISWFRYRGSRTLYALSHIEGQVIVYREGAFHKVNQSELVPGDIVKLVPGSVHCDMVLLTGTAVLDESALTGEATPQAKAPIEHHSKTVYDPKNHKRNTLSAGTKVVESDDALALALHTASFSAKGELLRDLLAFRRHELRIDVELPIVVLLLSSYSFFMFLFVIFNSSDELVVAWSLGMTAFSNAFPALLPISFTIPVGISFGRLAAKRVACSSSDAILIAGSVTKAFFDKTGTLTKQGLDYISSRSVESWNLGQWSSDKISLAMTTCHSLSLSEKGAILGHPVDRAMFAASGATLLSADGSTASIENSDKRILQVLRKFDFDHNRMTQSVIVRLTDGTVMAVVKGSGEKVAALCLPRTVPDNFAKRLDGYSRTGMYQIAVGTKTLSPDTQLSRLTRDMVESQMEFAGIMNFANRMREDTPQVILELQGAKVQPIMVTGDNLYTGIFIARASNIIPKGRPVKLGIVGGGEDGEGVSWKNEEGMPVPRPVVFGDPEKDQSLDLAMTGEAWQILLEEDYEYALKVAPFVHVFARCSPRDKVSVVDTFVRLGFTTMMCGDGGNDCGALKAAHVGIALSDSDASIVSPFTSLDKEISSVLTVLKEGRCAIASTIATYKYVVLYGNISSYCQLIMYRLEASYSDWMWVFMDGVWTVVFSLTLPLAKPAEKLTSARPTNSLLSWHTVCSATGIIVLHYIFCAIALYVLAGEDWYQCRKWDAEKILAGNILLASDNYEIQVTFLITGFQCLCSAMTFNFGYEFRQAWHRNRLFVAAALGFTFIHFWITLVPGELSCFWRANCVNENVVRGVADPEPYPINNPFNTTVMPVSFRYKLLIIMIANGLAVAFYDYFVVNGIRRYRSRAIGKAL